jgi:hypothetical protein
MFTVGSRRGRRRRCRRRRWVADAFIGAQDRVCGELGGGWHRTCRTAISTGKYHTAECSPLDVLIWNRSGRFRNVTIR